MIARYLVCPGFITSAHDGQRHWIKADELMMFYGVNPDECIIAPLPKIETIRQRDELTARVEAGELIALHPDSRGKYFLPKAG